MKDIISWLRKIEHTASEVYEKAALVFADDPEFKEFIERNAEDEAWHYHVMGSAYEFLGTIPEITPAISVDRITDDRISGYFVDMQSCLEQNRISKDVLIEKIVQAELSEWNDIFIYVVTVLKEKSAEFKYPAARIQAHIKNIENYLEKIDIGPEILRKIKDIPEVWVENILIVDDDKMISQLVRNILNRSGNIDTASNGKEALELIKKKYYKLIVSDVDMPFMNGFDLFRESVKAYPKTKHRFMFLTGNLSCERRMFFSENQIKCMQKPVGIEVFREEAEKIIRSE